MTSGAGPHSSFEKRALDRLREAGFRITMPRVQVIRALAASDRALSAHAIHEWVEQAGGRMDIVSVYRTLSTLVETHLVHHIGIVDGYLACGVEDHHDALTEHLVCRSCGKVTELEVPDGLAAATELNLKDTGFRAQEIKIEVLGVCSACQ